MGINAKVGVAETVTAAGKTRGVQAHGSKTRNKGVDGKCVLTGEKRLQCQDSGIPLLTKVCPAHLGRDFTFYFTHVESDGFALSSAEFEPDHVV